MIQAVTYFGAMIWSRAGYFAEPSVHIFYYAVKACGYNRFEVRISWPQVLYFDRLWSFSSVASLTSDE
jgi:hypothetical protein